MNKWVKGNGYWCADCKGTGRGKGYSEITYSGGSVTRLWNACETCGGDGRIAATPEQVISGTVPNTPHPERVTILSQLIEHIGKGETP